MSGPKPNYKIQLLENEISELRQLINARNSPQGKVMRARIVLAAHEHPEWSNQQIAAHVGCTDRAVRKWRRRWNESKRFVDFQAFLLEAIFPEALRRKVHILILILNNGTTHAPKQLENWLQEQVRLHPWPLTVQVYWLPTNASWLDQIEIWFSVLQRKLLSPNHFHSTDELAHSIMEFIRCENLSPKPIRWTYSVAKLEAKLGTL